MIIYDALNMEVVSHIPSQVQRILDVGCGDGSLGAYLKSDRNAEVVGITYSQEEAAIAGTKISKVIVADINSIDLSRYGKFDCIICSHVLEHLYEPVVFLQKIHAQLTETGVIIIALPNILHWKQRLKFLKGSFRYTEGGLMDKTHFRFYDWTTAQDLIDECNFTILTKNAYGAFPLSIIRSILPAGMSKKIDQGMCKMFPGLFGFQFVFSCKPNK